MRGKRVAFYYLHKSLYEYYGNGTAQHVQKTFWYAPRGICSSLGAVVFRSHLMKTEIFNKYIIWMERKPLTSEPENYFWFTAANSARECFHPPAWPSSLSDSPLIINVDLREAKASSPSTYRFAHLESTGGIIFVKHQQEKVRMIKFRCIVNSEKFIFTSRNKIKRRR